MSALDSLEESALESYVDVSFHAICVGYSAQYLWGSPLFSLVYWFFFAHMAGFWRARDRSLVPCDDRGSEVL